MATLLTGNRYTAQLYLGKVNAGGFVYTYEAGTLTPKDTFKGQSADSSTRNTNPVVLNLYGQADIWLGDGSYRIIEKTKTGVVVSDKDNIYGGQGTLLAENITYTHDAGVAESLKQKLGEFVTPQDFMSSAQRTDVSSGTGSIDVSAAIQAATNTGKTVYFPVGRYRQLTGTNFDGELHWYGDGAVVINDGPVLNCTNGSNSTVHGLRLENYTTPYVIVRSIQDWTIVPDIVLSNDSGGYQPTGNDADIYSSLTLAQKNQNISPTIFFSGNAENITVSSITGRFVTIKMFDCIRSTVKDCNFKAAKDLAGIVFWNINGQIGHWNRAQDNYVENASNSGIMFARNYDGFIVGNAVLMCGESGIKLYQDSVAGVDYRCYKMRLDNNETQFCYYDGLDISSDYGVPSTTTNDSRHVVTNNRTFGNRQTGFFHRGGGLDYYSNNVARKCGEAGFYVETVNAVFDGLYVYNCAQNASTTGNALTIGGDGHKISNIDVKASLGTYSFYAIGNNDVDSVVSDGLISFGNPGSVIANVSNIRGLNYVSDMHTRSLQLRQTDPTIPALQLYSEDINDDVLKLQFWARRHLTTHPSFEFRGQLVDGTPGAEKGRATLFSTYQGVQNPVLMLHEGRAAAQPFVVLSVPALAGAPNTTADMGPGNAVLYVDEAANNLKVVVKYSNGSTIKLGSISLS